MTKERALKEIVYTPDSELLNFNKLIRDMISDLGESRGLAWRLLVRNISAQYRQSFLGYAWAFIPPLFTTAIWVFLQSQKVISVADTGMPYVIFVLTGTVLWQSFVEATNSPLQMVNDSKQMLVKINFPREALILTGMGQVLFNFLVRVLILVPVFLLYGVHLHPGILFALIGALVLIIFGISLGLLLTPLGMLYQDVGRALAFGIHALFFLTPIIYPVPTSTWAGVLINLNPVTPLLQFSRDWMVLGTSSYLSGFLLVCGMSFVALILGWLLYRIAMPHIISRMSA